ncbi:MAG: CapA family protein [candidate division WOR-3 bacterium]
MRKILISLLPFLFLNSSFGYRIIENFESGSIILYSYPNEDSQPNFWRLDTIITHNNSRYSLKLYGNTWKIESITPQRIDTNSIWQVACYVKDTGEIQGMGFSDSINTLFYSFAGSEQLNIYEWITVYQGAFSVNNWHNYLLPIGEDWLNYFGYLPIIKAIIYINDRDVDTNAIVYFDDIWDITEDLPIAPQVKIWYTKSDIYKNLGRYFIDIQFYSRVIDPDSRIHQYFWDFGDGTMSNESCPRHTYLIRDDHEYTVLLRVKDSTNLWGKAITKVRIDSGPSTLPLKINFIGDIMLARRYEEPGGIIPTLGVESIFSPTKRYLGDNADITVANLESPLTNQGVRHPTKPIVFRGRPENVRGLVFAGIDFVSLANNHILDYLELGMEQTKRVLDSVGILDCGAGMNQYEAMLPNFINKKGINIGFLAFSDRTGQYNNYQPYLNAGYNKPGFAMLDTFYIKKELNKISQIADIKIVLLHSGSEYSLTTQTKDWEEDEFYSEKLLLPCSSDIKVRHSIIDKGADLIINHHPHIIQGFEVYQGKLIAHSLGNFCFDLDYSETYPSVILNGFINNNGFYRYQVIPIYIDRYIPKRATGELGIRILDYLSQRSREFNTYLIVDKDSAIGEIILDTNELEPTLFNWQETTNFYFKNGYFLSKPIKLKRIGSISKILQIIPQRNYEVRLGRELKWFWFGNFENEGSNMWLVNDTNRIYDTIAYRGRRSLLHYQKPNSPSFTTNLRDYLPCYSDTNEYTLYGYLKTNNVSKATVLLLCYPTRQSINPLGVISLDTVVGITNWYFYYQEFIPPRNTKFFDIHLRSLSPTRETSFVWYDDIGIIEWENWQPLENLLEIKKPNDYYWLQIRTRDSLANARILYEETGYYPSSEIKETELKEKAKIKLFAYPNPTKKNINIEYFISSPSFVSLKIYNLLGQEIKTIFSGFQKPGKRVFIWDRKDNNSKEIIPGIYFCQLKVDNQKKSYKLILLR